MSGEPKGLEQLEGTDQERIGTQHPMWAVCDYERDGFLCTRPDGHDGPHVAHGGPELAFAWWPAEADEAPAAMTGKTPTDYAIVAAMHRFGGSFVRALADACDRADPVNIAKLKAAFPEYWAEYTHMASVMRRMADEMLEL